MNKSSPQEMLKTGLENEKWSLLSMYLFCTCLKKNKKEICYHVLKGTLQSVLASPTRDELGSYNIDIIFSGVEYYQETEFSKACDPL